MQRPVLTLFQQTGVSLVGVLIGMTVLGIVSYQGLRMLTISQKAGAQLTVKLDRSNLVTLLVQSIDCRKTFESAGIDPLSPSGNCNSTSAENGQVEPFIRLRRASRGGGIHYLTPDLAADGTAVFNGFRVRVSCSEDEQTLVLRAAPVSEGIGALEDRHSLIFGSENLAGYPVCFSDLKSVPTADLMAKLEGGIYSDGPLEVPAGVKLTVRWNSTFASQCTIARNGVTTAFSGQSGTFVVPDDDPPAISSATVYKLTCENADQTKGATDSIVIKPQAVDADTFYDFGGMYSTGSHGKVNPATGAKSCPTDYTASAIRGKGSGIWTAPNTHDVPAFFCYRPHVDGQPPLYDFGGMYGAGIKARGVEEHFNNVLTGALSCPTGFTSQTIAYWIDVDYPLSFCYRTHNPSTTVPFSFGGAFGYGYGGTNRINPATGGLSCPPDHSSSQAHGSVYRTIDSIVKYCYKQN